MELPDESLAAAEQTVSQWDEQTPRAIYEHVEELDYGLAGALDRGLNVRYPHELEDEANCYEHAIYAYTLAEALDMEPRFFEAHEDATTHAFIDVQHDGDRVHIDQGRFGPVEYYGDTQLQLQESPVNDNLSKDYNRIEHKSEAELVQDIEDLREDTVAMIAKGQRLDKLEDGERTVYDKVNFHRDEDVFERMISFYEPIGHNNHLIRVRRHVDEDGEVTDTETVLADIDSAGWNKAWGEQEIGRFSDGAFQPADDLPDELRENVAKVMQYEDQAGDGLLYTDEEREKVWRWYSERVEHQISDGHTGFRGRSLKDELDRLESLRDNDPERFHTELDWLRFLHDTADQPIPDSDEVRELLPDYIDRHTDVLGLVRSQNYDSAIDTIADNLDSPTRETSPDIDVPERIDEIRERGMSSAYDDLADDLEAAIFDETEDTPTFSDMEKHHNLLAVDPGLQEAYSEILSYMAAATDSAANSERLDEELAAVEDLLPSSVEHHDDPFEDTTSRWEFDDEAYELVRTVTMDDGTTSTYDAVLELRYDMDELGGLNGIDVELYDTIDSLDDRLTYATFRVDKEEDITQERIQDAVTDNLERLQEQPNLDAPAPERQDDVIAKNPRGVAVYSIFFRDDEDMPHLWNKDELDDFTRQVREEAEFALASPFIPADEKDEAREEVQLANGDLFDDEWQHYAVAQHNKMISLQSKDEVTFDELVEDAFDEEERASEYAKKFYDIADGFIRGEDNIKESEEVKERVRRGIDARIPDRDDVASFAERHGHGTVDELNDVIASTGLSWEQKAERISDGLDELQDSIDDIGSVEEQEELYGSLLSFKHRIRDRRRYREWRDDTSLEDELAATREEVRDHVPLQEPDGLDDTVAAALEDVGTLAN
ncbi:MAG: hypothetical protein SV186_04715 [Candidatus Nanohaloarchaea archaeon]|nr:hypothetical protein [Candidatus Nanohaloarchaea archaeon]